MNDNTKKISINFKFKEQKTKNNNPKSPQSKLINEIKLGLNFRNRGDIKIAQNLYSPSKKEL